MQDTSLYQQMDPRFPEHEQMNCPRCDSSNTKFCYYNNYNLSQPRHYCKNCRRYWTKGGSIRNIPVGGGVRKTTKRGSKSQPLDGNRSVDQDRRMVRTENDEFRTLNSNGLGKDPILSLDLGSEPNLIRNPVVETHSGDKAERFSKKNKNKGDSSSSSKRSTKSQPLDGYKSVDQDRRMFRTENDQLGLKSNGFCKNPILSLVLGSEPNLIRNPVVEMQSGDKAERFSGVEENKGDSSSSSKRSTKSQPLDGYQSVAQDRWMVTENDEFGILSSNLSSDLSLIRNPVVGDKAKRFSDIDSIKGDSSDKGSGNGWPDLAISLDSTFR